MGALSLCLILRAIFHPPVEHWAHAIAMPKIYSTSQTHAHTNVGMKQKYKKKRFVAWAEANNPRPDCEQTTVILIIKKKENKK